jgi:hypothetical protein
MKKITFFAVLLITAFGFSQTVLEDFEGTPNIVGFEGLGEASVVDNPSVDAMNGSAKVAKLVVVTAGNPWQGADLIFQENYINVADPVTNKVTMDVFSNQAFTMYAETNGGIDGAVKASADDTHSGNGWEKLEFIFNENLNNVNGAANGDYEKLSFFPNWNGSGWNDPEVPNTVYIDNITGTQGSAIVVEPVDDIPLSPDPTSGTGNADADVLSIFSDDGQFSNNYGTDFAFGEEFRTIVDLDTGDGVNNVVKLELDRGGWGAGNNAEVELIASGFTHFNFSYYMPTSTAGTEGHLLQATLVSRTPGQAQAPDAVVNITGTPDAPNSYAALEFDKWVNLSIPLSAFTNFQTHLLLFKFGTPSTAFSPLVYIDNVFFSKSAVTLSTKNNNISGFRMFPNPAENQLNISAKELISNVELFNVLGKRVKSFSLNATKESLDISDLSSGIYLVKFVSGGKLGTAKFIKQ